MLAQTFTEKQVSDSVQIMDVLGDGELLYDIVESRRDCKDGNFVPFDQMDDMDDGEDLKGFKDLSESERSEVIREATGHLFSKNNVVQAIRVMECLLDSNRPSNHNVKTPDGFGIDKWRELRDNVVSIKSVIQIDAAIDAGDQSKGTGCTAIS